MNTYVEKILFVSYLFDNVEYSNNTVSSCASKLIALVTKINCEHSSTHVLDLSDRLEHLICIENFDFICSTSTSDDEISGCLQELSGGYLACSLRW